MKQDTELMMTARMRARRGCILYFFRVCNGVILFLLLFWIATRRRAEEGRRPESESDSKILVTQFTLTSGRICDKILYGSGSHHPTLPKIYSAPVNSPPLMMISGIRKL